MAGDVATTGMAGGDVTQSAPERRDGPPVTGEQDRVAGNGSMPSRPVPARPHPGPQPAAPGADT
ncbi:MAG: hypothetical protein ACM32E_21465, partial [Gemmatimonadota bacterium]